jgi:hypothetical protein
MWNLMVYPCACRKCARHVVVSYHTFSPLALNGSEFNIFITLHCLEGGSNTYFIEEPKFINVLERKILSHPLS